MRKSNYFKWFTMLSVVFGITAIVSFSSCKKDSDDPDTVDPIASFQYNIDEGNWLLVSFTNNSQNATSYSWDFGDGNNSTEKDVTHVYDAAGDYTVNLTASNDAGSSITYSKNLTLTDPNSARKLLTGEESKTWKLFREGTCMSLGPNPDDPAAWWPGLTNDGARPCLYAQTFTFHNDGKYVFNDAGFFWGEYGVFDGQDWYETCFPAEAEYMINKDGVDVSAWLSGEHSFTYDPSTGSVTLDGDGAWIGIPKLGPAGETTVPLTSTSFNVDILPGEGYDLMTLSFNYADAGFWLFQFVSYHDPSLEPEVVTIQPPYGEDLPDLTPEEMWNTFETSNSWEVLDTAGVYPGLGSAANGGMSFTMNVADPAGAGVNVGQYDRAGTYQELQFMMQYDIQFDNFTTVSVDVYVPSSNDYSGTLTKGISVIIGESSQTPEWWTGHIQYDAEATVMDEWVTYTWNLNEPSSGPGGYTPFDRTNLDFFAISIGGGGHEAEGTFYVRNFTFN